MRHAKLLLPMKVQYVGKLFDTRKLSHMVEQSRLTTDIGNKNISSP